ncbi:hypothetical protein V8E52_011671 [Russula decolorans]|jgi:hypothetical protein
MQSEDTKITVPKLSADGSNWVIYRNWLVYSLNAHGLDIHLTHDTPTQEYIDEGDIGGLTTQARWRKGEGHVKTLLGTSVPDDVFNRISAGGTAKGV